MKTDLIYHDITKRRLQKLFDHKQKSGYRRNDIDKGSFRENNICRDERLKKTTKRINKTVSSKI